MMKSSNSRKRSPTRGILPVPRIKPLRLGYTGSSVQLDKYFDVVRLYYSTAVAFL